MATEHDNPAERFLLERPVTRWHIEDYVREYKKYELDDLCDSWIRELTKLKDNKENSERVKSVAKSLINSYKTVS